MTEGISKEKLEEMLLIVQENKERYFSQNLWLFESDMLRRLISECTELDPWLPIDENTPKGKPIHLFYPQYGKHDKSSQIIGIIPILSEYLSHPRPTKWKELPPDPK